MSFTGMCLLLECMKYHLLELEQKRNFPSPRTRLRTPPKVFLHDSFFLFVCLFLKTCLNFNNRRFSLLLRVIPTEQSCYDFETERWSPVAEIPTGKARYPLLSISFLIAQSPFIFVFQIFALEYLLLMDVCMQFVDQMEFVAWKQPM